LTTAKAKQYFGELQSYIFVLLDRNTLLAIFPTLLFVNSDFSPRKFSRTGLYFVEKLNAMISVFFRCIPLAVAKDR